MKELWAKIQNRPKGGTSLRCLFSVFGGDLHLAGINFSYFEFSFFHSAGWVPFRDNFNICAHLI